MCLTAVQFKLKGFTFLQPHSNRPAPLATLLHLMSGQWDRKPHSFGIKGSTLNQDMKKKNQTWNSVELWPPTISSPFSEHGESSLIVYLMYLFLICFKFCDLLLVNVLSHFCALNWSLSSSACLSFFVRSAVILFLLPYWPSLEAHIKPKLAANTTSTPARTPQAVWFSQLIRSECK